MSVYSGDFLGFSLGNIHSSQLNITRISSGDRYTDGLIPTFQDQTVQVPGGDGTYYWDTFYTQKTFQIDFAFDDLRDEDMRALRQMFAFKGVQPLIFDEFPYKKYMVKVAQPPQLKYIPFDHLEFRIYKGEGSVQLVAYYPYALGVASPHFDDTSEGIINNNGDMPANLEVIYQTNINCQRTLRLYDINNENNIYGSIKLRNMVYEGLIKDNDTHILINHQTHLIEGLKLENNNYIHTGNLYNNIILEGDFFKPPVGCSKLKSFDNSNVGRTFVKATYTPLFY